MRDETTRGGVLRRFIRGRDLDIGCGEDQTLGDAEAAIELVIQKVKEELSLRSKLDQLLVCPECGKLDLVALGMDEEGQIKMRCSACGVAGHSRFQKTTRSNERK